MFLLLSLGVVFEVLPVHCFSNRLLTTHFFMFINNDTKISLCLWLILFPPSLYTGSHGVMVSTLDFESSDLSSNLGGTSKDFFLFFNLSRNKPIFFCCD